MLKLDVEVLSTRPHASQIAAGLLMLSDRLGQDRLQVRFENGLADPRYPVHSIPVLVARGGGKTLVYDLEDSCWTRTAMRALLDEADLYFMRSYCEKDIQRSFNDEQRAKMRPLGLNYFVDYPGNPYAFGCSPFEETALRKAAMRAKALRDGRYLPEVFERAPGISEGGPRALFFARLWDPGEVDERWRSDREETNRTRIDIVRTLRAELGARFSGGLVDTQFARRVAPDLVVPQRVTIRASYLAMVKSSDVCVATTGLHGSVGGKLGEYVAASRGIVTEPLQAVLPGGFDSGRNYREFSDADGCVEAVCTLLDDNDALLDMQRANHDYYLEYLRPDKLVERTLVEAGLL